MAIMKVKGSRFWWYSVYVKGRSRLRGSTGTEDKEIAKGIEQAIRMAHRKASPAERIHALVDILLGDDQKKGLPITNIWQQYQNALVAINKELSERTLRLRRQRCGNLVAWVQEHHTAITYAGQVDRAAAAAYALYLAERGTTSKTRSNILSDIATVWSCLQRVTDAITTNPWRLVIPTVTDSRRGKAFTVEQEQAILAAADAIKGCSWGLACRIARHTGLRQGDVVRLRWEQINLADGVISVVPGKTKRHNIAVLLPITGILRQALGEQRPSGFLMPDLAHAASVQHFKVPFRQVLDAANIGAGYTFHSWRHTFRTRLSEAGVSDDVAKRLGGWTDDRTAERYDHATRLEALAQAVEAAAGAR